MLQILGVPYFCFHDADVHPEGATFAESTNNLEAIVDYFAEKMDATGIKLLWGTANLFSHKRFMSGAATNPDPDVFAYFAATIKIAWTRRSSSAAKTMSFGAGVKATRLC
ncbi:MAG: xylose isomerase [Yoonia sp.]|jgi:xylose isomerase